MRDTPRWLNTSVQYRQPHQPAASCPVVGTARRAPSYSGSATPRHSARIDRGVHAPMPRDCVDRLHEAVSKAQVRSMEAFRCAQSLLWTFISCLQLGAVAARASSTMSPAVCTFSPVHLFPFFWLPLGALGVAPQGAREWQYTHHAHGNVWSMKKGRGDRCRRVTAGLAR